jgi:hypothetical protein
VTGFFATAMLALPQAYTISAKPGAVNFVEGNVLLDGQPMLASGLKSIFLNAGSLLETREGKAEVLLTPGVFLRVGENSQVRMLRPSLIGTQIAIESGESMLEVDEYIRDSHLAVTCRGASIEIEKTGLYRFNADGEASVAVIDGKAQVSFGEKHENVGRGHEAILSDALKTRKFNKDREDELYAWSNIRAQYNASLSYQAARSVSNSSFGGGYGGYNGFYGSGWLWNSGFNSWLWMPGNTAFFSPFGWGFYGPGTVAYAPVVVVPVAVRGGGVYGSVPVRHPHPGPGNGAGGVITVPVNARQMPAVGFYGGSPAAYSAARVQAARAMEASGGLRTQSGAQPRPFSNVQGGAGSHPAATSSGSAHWTGGGAAGGGNSGGGHWNGGGGGAANGGGGAASSHTTGSGRASGK